MVVAFYYIVWAFATFFSMYFGLFRMGFYYLVSLSKLWNVMESAERQSDKGNLLGLLCLKSAKMSHKESLKLSSSARDGASTDLICVFVFKEFGAPLAVQRGGITNGQFIFIYGRIRPHKS